MMRGAVAADTTVYLELGKERSGSQEDPLTFPPPIPRGTSRSVRSPPSVFSLAEGILPEGRFNGGGPPPPTPAIHFTASERMGELISDISRGKGFMRAVRRREHGSERVKIHEVGNEDKVKEVEQGEGQRGQKGVDSKVYPLSFPAVVHHVTRASLLCRYCLLYSPGEKRNILSLNRV